MSMQCYHCGSERVVTSGPRRNGKQRFLCRACGRTLRENPQPQLYSEARKAEILRAYQERSSLRGLERTFGVSRQTVSSWLKKVAELPRLEETLLPCVAGFCPVWRGTSWS